MSKKICIDIGHGINTYPPSKGVGDFAEFSFNNAVGKVATQLLKEHGFDVYLSQPYDAVCVPLNNRIRAINKENCDLVVSIHANASSNIDANGHWIFHWYSAKDSKEVAEICNKNAREMLPNKDGGIWTSKPNHWSNFGILRDTDCTAILCEFGFYTNRKELELLKTNEFRSQCAKVICKTVCEYFKVSYEASETIEDLRQRVRVLEKEKEVYEITIKSIQDMLNAVNEEIE